MQETKVNINAQIQLQPSDPDVPYADGDLGFMTAFKDMRVGLLLSISPGIGRPICCLNHG
eukprot:419203-Prorocentrum_lima.AAC.1